MNKRLMICALFVVLAIFVSLGSCGSITESNDDTESDSNTTGANGGNGTRVAYMSSASGAIGSAATWGGVGVPGPNDSITIRNDHTITSIGNYVVGDVIILKGGVLSCSEGVVTTIFKCDKLLWNFKI